MTGLLSPCQKDAGAAMRGIVIPAANIFGTAFSTNGRHPDIQTSDIRHPEARHLETASQTSRDCQPGI